MKVLRIIDTNRLSEIIVKNDNRMLIPVNDGVGNLIVGPEVLVDPAFEKIQKVLGEITEEIEYIPFVEQDDDEISSKLDQFRSEGKCIIVESATRVDFGGVKIDITETKDITEIEEPKGILNTMKSWANTTVNWVKGLFS